MWQQYTQKFTGVAIMKPKKILVLSGGNIKGAFQAGVLSVMLEEEEFDAVFGISVGAINAAAVATGKFDEMFKRWQEVEEKDFFYRRSPFRIAMKFLGGLLGIGRLKGFHSIEPLRDLLHETLAGNQLQIPTYLGWVDVMSGQYFSKLPPSPSTKEIVDAAIRSASIPVIMDPQPSGGGMLSVDGGIHSITPIGDVLDNYMPDEIEEIVIITTQQLHKNLPMMKRDRDKVNVIDMAQYTISYLLDIAFARDLKQFIEYNKVVGQAPGLTKSSGAVLEFIPFRLIEPSKHLGPGDDYSRENISRLIQLGIDEGIKHYR